MPLVARWRVVNHVVCTWEIAIDAVEKILPARLEPVELRPGVGLISVGCLRYATGQFGAGSPEFNEVVTAVQVQPDLSLKMPQPRFAFYTVAMWSDCADFVTHEARHTFTPTSHAPSLRLAFSPDGLGVEASAAGEPILSVRSTAPLTQFTPCALWGQHYNNTKGLHLGIWRWEGTRYDHMKRGDAGRPLRHQHFADLDVSKVMGCYHQMFAEPGRTHNEVFYRMLRLD